METEIESVEIRLFKEEDAYDNVEKLT